MDNQIPPQLREQASRVSGMLTLIQLFGDPVRSSRIYRRAEADAVRAQARLESAILAGGGAASPASVFYGDLRPE